MRELLLAAAGEVLKRGVISHDPGKYLEIRDPAGEGIVGSLKNISRCRLRIGDVTFGRMAVAGSIRRSIDSAVLSRCGTVINNKIQEMVGADVAQPGGKDYRENPVV